jgi:hypothetical protein
LAADVTKWTGNDTRPLEYSVSELASPEAEPVLRDVQREGLTVAGSRSWLNRQLRHKNE